MKTLSTSLKMKRMRICLKVRASFKWVTSVGVMAAVLACPALGSTHWAIITDLSDTPHPSASMDVSTDTGGSVDFVVVPLGGGPTAPSNVAIDGNGFASSLSSTFPNLFTVSGGVKGALVRAIADGGISSALLRQQTGKSEFFSPSHQWS